MSLVYLVLTTLKNNLKELVRRPSKLILMLFLVAMMVFVLMSGSQLEYVTDLRAPEELYSLILALFAAVFVMLTLQGLDSGASFFSMADVHMLFSAPILPLRVLFYGLIKQIGTSLLLGYFLLFQYGWLHSAYGLSIGGLVWILLGYCLCLFCAQLTAMTIYSFTSGSERAQRAVRWGIYAVCALAVGAVLLPALQSPDGPLAGAARAAGGWALSLIPVAGWIRGLVVGLIAGDLCSIILFLGVMLLYILALLYALVRARADFYEDVLLATEVSFSAITAKKQGTMQEAAPRHVKVGRTGLGRGSGAAAFYYKHRIENRRSRVFILDRMSMIFLLVNWGFAWFMRDNGLIPILAFGVYMQIFSVATGRWVRELTLPYIYLLPQPPFRKLIHLCREGVERTAVEAVVLFVPVAFLVGAPLPELVGAIAVRIGFGLLFIAGNLVIERLFGDLVSRTLILMLYFLGLLVLCIPGIVVGVVAAILLSSTAVAFFAIALWNTALAALLVYLCRNILSYAELNNR